MLKKDKFQTCDTESFVAIKQVWSRRIVIRSSVIQNFSKYWRTVKANIKFRELKFSCPPFLKFIQQLRIQNPEDHRLWRSALGSTNWILVCKMNHLLLSCMGPQQFIVLGKTLEAWDKPSPLTGGSLEEGLQLTLSNSVQWKILSKDMNKGNGIEIISFYLWKHICAFQFGVAAQGATVRIHHGRIISELPGRPDNSLTASGAGITFPIGQKLSRA